MVSFGLLAATVLAAAAGLVSADDIQYKTMTLMGCYKSSQGMNFSDTYTWQSSGHCQKQCVPSNKAVLATTGESDCWCGDTMPPKADLVDSSKCTANCSGWPSEMCGSLDGKYFSVWNDGLKTTVKNLGATSADDSSSSSTSTATQSVVTVGGETQTITAAPSNKSSGSGPNKAAIAAGVIVGLIAIAGIAGGVLFFLRRKRKQEENDEMKRQEAISNFVHAGKPGSSGGTSATDSRLDPAIFTRRQSDGSIADNQDYSRRILKVTNA